MVTTGHRYWSYLCNFLADLNYFGVNYMVYEDSQFSGEIFCDNVQSFNKITQDLIKFEAFPLQINVTCQHFTNVTSIHLLAGITPPSH